jgi:hypothetical protein
LTISSTNRKAGPFTGNGVTVAFPFAFKVFATTEVLVVQAIAGIESTQTLVTDYTVVLNADQNANPGGTVTRLVPPAVGATLILTSQVANLQATDLTNLGGFYPKVINDALDRTTIQIQQLAEQASRSIKVGISDTTTADVYRDSLLSASAAAVSSASNALASKNSASTSEINAATSATSALASKNSASTSEINAATSATSALASKNSASTSEINALVSKNASAISETSALSSKNASAASEGNAGASALAAQSYLGSLIQPFFFLSGVNNGPCLVKTGASSLSIQAGTSVIVNAVAKTFAVTTAVTMPMLTVGTDYAVWVNPDGTVQAVADPYSAPASAPQAGSVKIGGFHYSLVAPGTTVSGGGFSSAGFTGTGGSMIWSQTRVDIIAGINAYTLWDLTWCCAGEQRGFALDPQTNTWLAIYFCSTDHITNGISRYNTDVASGTVLPRIPVVYGGTGATNYGRLSFYEAQEIAASHGLRLPTFAEFSSAAFGVTEAQSLGGAASTIPATARQAGYTSRIGLEQATGHQYAVGGPLSSVGGAGWDTSPGRGSFYGTTGLPLFGGYRVVTSDSGSRTANFGSPPWNSTWFISLRAAGDHKKLKGIGS